MARAGGSRWLPAAIVAALTLGVAACEDPVAAPVEDDAAAVAQALSDEVGTDVPAAAEREQVDQTDRVQQFTPMIDSREEAIAQGMYGTVDDEAVVMPEFVEPESAEVEEPAPAPEPQRAAAPPPAPAEAPRESTSAAPRTTEQAVEDDEPADEPESVEPPPAAATGSGSRQSRVEAIADSLPFDWRRAGVSFSVGCAPGRAVCNWGLYTAGPKLIWIGPDAFASEARLFYVVAHEVAHAWQYANDPHSRMDDLKDWHRVQVDGLEAAADCLARVWGASASYYWNCPASAQRHMEQVFNSTQ